MTLRAGQPPPTRHPADVSFSITETKPIFPYIPDPIEFEQESLTVRSQIADYRFGNTDREETVDRDPERAGQRPAGTDGWSPLQSRPQNSVRPE